MEKNFTVYKHTNVKNGKVYIGITSQKPEKRWREDGSGYKNQPKFFNAILKYGWHNFRHDVLYTNLNEKDAISLEKQLISECNSIVNGYNQRRGGISVPKYKDIEQKLRLSESHKGQTSPMKGKKHSTKSLEKMSKCKRRKVIGINMDNFSEVSFQSTKEAAVAMGLSNGSGIAACAGKRNGIKSIANHVWYYENCKKPTIDEIINIRDSIKSQSLRNTKLHRKILAKDITSGNELIFNSVKEAAIYFKKDTPRIRQHIAAYCKHKQKYLNHIWKYID